MRSYAVLVAGSAALALAQSDTGIPEIPTPTGVDAEASSIAAEINSCLRDCDDIECQAACIAVPAPNESQVNANTECATECDQGEGSEADTLAYGQCLAQCAGEHYFSAGEGTPRPTGAGSDSSDEDTDASASADDAAATASDDEAAASGSADASASGSDSDDEASGSATGSGSDEASATGDSDSAEESGDSESSEDGEDDDSAATTVLAGSALGVFGFVAAFFL